MKILIVAAGRIKEKNIRAAIDEYSKRIGRYASLREVELEDGREVALRMAKAIPERARVVALEIDGNRLSSEGLARYVERCEVGAVPALVFVIGGAYGLPQEISAAAHLRLSLSDMTLPHRLARLFLVEQIYRAFTISRHEPYSH